MSLVTYLQTEKITQRAALQKWNATKEFCLKNSAYKVETKNLCSEIIKNSLFKVQSLLPQLKTDTDAALNKLSAKDSPYAFDSNHLIPSKVISNLTKLQQEIEKFNDEGKRTALARIVEPFNLKIIDQPVATQKGEITLENYEKIKRQVEEIFTPIDDPKCGWILNANRYELELAYSLKKVFSAQNDPEQMFDPKLNKQLKILSKVTDQGIRSIDNFFNEYEGGLDASLINQVCQMGEYLINLKQAIEAWKDSYRISINCAKGMVPSTTIHTKT